MLSNTRVSVVPAVLVCAVLINCNRAAGPERGSSTPAAGPAAASLPDSARRVLVWLPADNDVPGWSRQGEPRHFVPANLWEYIDGGAEAYLRFDFQELVALSYVNKATGLKVGIDLYRMASPLGAFGIYAQELNPAATFLAVGAEGYLDGTALSLWTGSCYVKLISATDHPDLAAGLKALAAETARRIGGDARRPAEFDRFPTAGLVARSFKVVPRDVLGQSYLAGGFEAEYGTGKTGWKLTLIPFDGADRAEAALGRYREFVSANGTIARHLAEPGSGGFVGRDRYYGTVVAMRSGESIAIALGPPSERAALDALSQVLKRR